MARLCAPKKFTLIELLMVVSIVIMLLAILLPSLSRVKEQAKQVICFSNERQMAQIFTSYSNDYNGCWPPVRRDGGFSGPYWYETLFRYTFTKPWTDQNLFASIFSCKSYPCPQNWCPGYGMNYRLARSFASAITSNEWCKFSVRPSRVNLPSKWPLTADRNNWFIDSGTIVEMDFPHNYFHATFEAWNTKHYGTASILYCDGHVASVAYARYKVVQ